MKVLHCIPGMGGGGAERQLAYLAGPLAKRGWEVHVALGAGGSNLPRLKEGGAVVHRLTASSNHDPRLGWQLAKVFRRVRPDIVQVWFVQMEVLAGAISELFRVPRVISERSSVLAYPPTIKNRLRVAIARTADAIVSNSAAGDAYWEGRVSRGVARFVIHNALPLEEIAAARPAVPGGLAVKAGDALVLFAGRFAPEKNLASMLTALGDIVKRPRTVGVLCGDGPLRGEVQQKIGADGLGDRIFTPGYVADLWPLMKRADVVVAVGLFEGRPNVVLEAMAAGRPLVVSDIPAHREILDAGSASWVDGRDAAGIARAVLQVLDDPVAAERRAAAARSLAVQWSIAGAAAEYRSCLPSGTVAPPHARRRESFLIQSCAASPELDLRCSPSAQRWSRRCATRFVTAALTTKGCGVRPTARRSSAIGGCRSSTSRQGATSPWLTAPATFTSCSTARSTTTRSSAKSCVARATGFDRPAIRRC